MAVQEGMAVDAVVHDILMTWFVGLEWFVVLAAPTVLAIAKYYKLFEKFPNCIFKWLVAIDWCLAFFAGVLRWTPGSPALPVMGYGDKVSDAACRAVAFGDTFFHTSTLYCNTLIIGCIFHMIYFQSKGGFGDETARTKALRLMYLTSTLFAAFSGLGPVHRWLGWCTMDSAGVVIKMLFTCFLISVQVVVLIPTFVIMATGNFEARGVGIFLLFIRFFGLIVFQCIGIIPMVIMEFLAYVRKPIPISLMEFVLVGIPLSQIVNILLLFQKCLPAMFTQCKFMDSSMTLTSGSFSRSEDSRDGAAGDKKGGNLRSHRKKKSSKKSKKKAYRECKLMDKIPFKVHITLVILLPVLLAGGLALMLTGAKEHIVEKAYYDHSNLLLAEKMSEVVHELQHERGRTGEWQGAHGTKYHVEVKEQRELTDVALEHFRDFLDNDYSNGKILTSKKFVAALGPIQLLEEHRELVTHLALPTDEALHFYSDMIEKLMAVIELLFHYAGSESIDPLVYASVTYLTHEETMAIEEGWGGIGFAENGWDSLEHNVEFIQLIAEQKASLYLFHGYAEDDAEHMYEEISHRPENVEIKRLRKYAMANDKAHMTEYSGRYWYEKMTKKLKGIWEVEDYLAAQLTEMSDHNASEAMDEVTKIIGISAACLIVSGLLGLAVTQALSKAISDGKKVKKCIGMTLTGHITLHAFLATTVLLTVVVLLIDYDATILRSASEVQINMRLRKLMMPVIQALQKERGLVGVFMGSHGKEFHHEKLEQAKKTDHQIKELFAYINGGYYKMPYIEKNPSYKKFIKDLEDLPHHRQKIYNFQETKDEAMYAYTHTIADMLHCIEAFTVTGKGTKHHTNNQLFALISLQFAKEMLGDEDAVGSLAYAAHEFEDHDMWVEYVSVVGETKTFVDYFKTYADPATTKLYTYYLEHDKTQKRVYQMRDYLIHQDTEQMHKIKASYWYGNMTLYVQKYKDVEDHMYADIKHLYLDPIKQVEKLENWLTFLITLCFLSAATVWFHAQMDPSAVALMQVEDVVQNVRCDCGAKMTCGVCHVDLPRGAYAKIGFSSFNAELAGLGHQTRQMLKDGCDYIHLDVMDSQFVPNLSFGVPMVASVRRYNPKAFIVAHMMVSDPENLIYDVQKAGASMFVFHIEAVEEPIKLINKIKDLNMKVGVAIQPETPIDRVLPLVRMVHMVTVMANKQNTGSINRREFNHNYMPKVKELRAAAPLLDIEVEGGVTFDSIDFCARAGANFIAGEAGHLGGMVGIHKLKRAVQKRIYDRRTEFKTVKA